MVSSGSSRLGIQRCPCLEQVFTMLLEKKAGVTVSFGLPLKESNRRDAVRIGPPILRVFVTQSVQVHNI